MVKRIMDTKIHYPPISSSQTTVTVAGTAKPYRGGPVNQATASERRLPVDRAFVVQFWTTAAVATGRLEGRVEHVVSGQATHFASVEDLLAFMARVLHQRRPADEGASHGRTPGRQEAPP